MPHTVHPEDMKAGLRKIYGTLLKFEEAEGLPKGSAKDVVRGRAVAQTERAISKALNKPLHVLFPTRYEAEEDESSTKGDDTPLKGASHRLIVSGG